MRKLDCFVLILVISLAISFNSASADFQTSTNSSMTMFAAMAVFTVILTVMIIMVLIFKQVESVNIKMMGLLAISSVIVLFLMYSMFSIGTQIVANSVFIPPRPPGPSEPVITDVIATSGTTIHVIWSESDSSVNGYRIDRESPINTGFSTIIANTSSTLQNYNDTGLSIGTTYNYIVYALNPQGSTVSNNQLFTTTWNVPLAPNGLSATALSTTSIALSWASPLSDGGTPITGYKIDRQDSCSGSYNTIVANTGNTLTNYNNTGLVANTCYSYKTSAINGIGTGASSTNASKYTPTNPPKPPGPPTNLKANTLSDTQIFLFWTAPVAGPVNGYEIMQQLGTSGGFGIVTANTTNTTAHYTITGLIPNTLYQYKVFSLNKTGTSVASNIAQNTTLIFTVPGTPTGLSAVTQSNSKIKLSWAAPSNNGNHPINGYKIVRQDACTGSYNTIVANTSNTLTNYNNTGLTSSTCYSYEVAAGNLLGFGSFSSSASATTSPLTLPNPPTNLIATTLSTSSIRLTWTAPSGTTVSGYFIEQKGPSGGFGQLANTTNSTTHYTVTGLTASTLYQYRVSTWNINGTGSPSGIAQNFTFTIPGSKIFNAAVLQYVHQNDPSFQGGIYSPMLDPSDFIKLREQSNSFRPGFINMVMTLTGTKCAEEVSLAVIQAQAVNMSNLGFNCMDYDIESGTSPASDLVNATNSVRLAEIATHNAGLTFRVSPSYALTRDNGHGAAFAHYVDYYHIQEQSKQGTCTTGTDTFRNDIVTDVAAIRGVNKNIIITVQVTFSDGSNQVPGLSLLQTGEACFTDVVDQVNGTGAWFSNSSTSTDILTSFVNWFHTNYD